MEKKYSLSKQAFIISFGKTINRLAALFAIMYLSYNLSKDIYGSYRQVWLLFNTLVPILSIGIPISVNYFIPLLKDSQRKYFVFQTYALLCILGFLFSLIMFFGANSFSVLFENPEVLHLAKYFSIIPFLCLPTLFYQNLFVCLNNPLLATKVSLFSSVTYLSAIIIPIYYGYSISDMIIILTYYYLIQFLLIGFLIYKMFKNIEMQYSFGLIKKQIYYAVPVGLTAAIGIISMSVDKIFISSFFTTEEFAEYANGAMELPFIGIITGSIMAVLMPKFVKLYNSDDIISLIRIWKSSIRKVAFMFFPLMCILFIFSEQLIILFFSEKYLESVDIFRIYLLQLPCRITIFGIVLLSINQTSFVLKSTLLYLIFNISLNFILIKSLGIVGPAIATIISLYFISFLQLEKISCHMNSKISQILPWSYLGKILVISIFVGFVIYQFNIFILNQYLSTELVDNIIRIFIGGASYIILFVWMCLITKTSNKENILKYINNVN